jgi:type IX secretion system PorP/SprF family membrane protein
MLIKFVTNKDFYLFYRSFKTYLKYYQLIGNNKVEELKISIYIVLLFLSVLTYGQQDPEFSQHISAMSLYNPGSAGSHDRICLNALHREQWVGFPGKPSTSYFSADGAFSLFGKNLGAGISILNDNFGFNSDLGINLQGSYRIDVGAGKLGIGLNLGVLNKSLSPEWKTIDDKGVEGTGTGDDAIPTKGSKVAFDMGLGVFYRAENIFMGISTTHLNQARISYSENATTRMVRHYYVIAGYNLQLPNPMFELTPYFLLKSDGRVNQIYLNTTLKYNKRFWGGVSYRGGDAIVGLLGLELFNGVRVAYSYDFTTSKIGKYSDGSHELSIGYCFDLSLDKSPQKYKSIRFL